MKFRSTALLVALPAVLAGLLVSVPADAASYYALVKTRTVAISPDGLGKVLMTCGSTSTCTGKLSFTNSSTRTTSYSVAGKSSKYVTIATRSNEDAYPYEVNGGDNSGHPDYWSKPATIFVNEDSPKNVNHSYTPAHGVATETPVLTQKIEGKVHFHESNPATEVNVDLVSVARGGSQSFYRMGTNLSDGASFSKTVRLGVNNSSSSEYRIRISGRDQDGHLRSWYWRGSNGSPSYGGKYLREASVVKANKYGPFTADFHTGSVRGQLLGAYGTADVTVAAPPASYSSSAVTNRDLDLSGCANIFGETEVVGSGSYEVNFLPYVAGSKHFIVRADDHTTDQARWNGLHGSCWDVLNYTPGSTSNLIVPNGADAPESNLNANTNSITVNPDFASSPATSDRFIRLRERIPNTSILEAPVVAEGFPNMSGDRREFKNLPAGSYWVEVGRRTGCSDWYPSRYSNNSLYFRGEDRSAESWKSFRRLYELSGGPTTGKEGIARSVQPNPADSSQNKIKSGYNGWMYRGYCGSTSAGSYSTVSINHDTNVDKHMGTVRKGATVTGRVVRGGGRTNKEMMVSLYSTSHTLVMRTDLTDGSGRFSVKGLASGTYHIRVNGDSWRGITRTFSGRHTIKVSAGNTYGVGTLRFQNQSDTADAD